MTTESATNVVAVGAVSSPWWLTGVSHFAADALPILGAVWLIIQITHKIKNWKRS